MKLKKELYKNNIDSKDKNHHQLKQEYTRLHNKRYIRLIDKIINCTK